MYIFSALFLIVISSFSPTPFLQFPQCDDNEAISVACLDLHYHVTVDKRMELKDEKKDTRSPLTIRGLRPELEDELHEMNLTDKMETGSELCPSSSYSSLIILPPSLILPAPLPLFILPN